MCKSYLMIDLDGIKHKILLRNSSKITETLIMVTLQKLTWNISNSCGCNCGFGCAFLPEKMEINKKEKLICNLNNKEKHVFCIKNL